MSRFSITNIGSDLYESEEKKIGANVIRVELAEKEFQFPMIAPHQNELEKAKSAGIRLHSPLVQYVHRVEGSRRITSDSIKNEISEKISKVFDENPELIGDSFFQFWQNYPPRDSERVRILEAQHEANSLIISDYETNPQQSTNQLEAKLLETLGNYPKNIVSPTLDIGMKPVELFQDKLDLLFDLKIKRFNVIYRSFIDELDNWIALSNKLYAKNIWCNVVGIPQRFYSKQDPFSLISTVFLFGAHTASLQYPRFSKAKKTELPRKPTKPNVYMFNPNTGYFESNNSMSDEESRARSINALVNYLHSAQQHISVKTYYKKFVSNQFGLYGILKTIP